MLHPDFPEWDREEAASEITHLRALLAEAGYRIEALEQPQERVRVGSRASGMMACEPQNGANEMGQRHTPSTYAIKAADDIVAIIWAAIVPVEAKRQGALELAKIIDTHTHMDDLLAENARLREALGMAEQALSAMLEPTCNECTEGQTPLQFDKGPCAWRKGLAANRVARAALTTERSGDGQG